MKSFKILMKGVFMGIADLVPGISGGTIALIFNIYEKLISSLSKLSIKSLAKFKESGLISFWVYINGKFLLLLFSGILIGIFFFTYVIDWLINNYITFLLSFFSGLILSSSYLIFKRIKKPNYNLTFFFILGIISSLSIVSFNYGLALKFNSNTLLFVSGFFAISAMILPGLSGAYILILFGTYSEVISLLKEVIKIVLSQNVINAKLIFSKLSFFALGIISGLLIFSKIVKWLLNNYYDKTIMFMIGLMIGGIIEIWPWQQNGQPVLPFNYIENSNFLLASIFFTLGGSIIFGLNFLEKKLNDEKEKNIK
ncbi:MAG: hypothetical protein CMC81_04835 [Flavobacteriaceae bacterium]|nr:hypothetical protein [Flavobacteriaceae bacterium]